MSIESLETMEGLLYIDLLAACCDVIHIGSASKIMLWNIWLCLALKTNDFLFTVPLHNWAEITTRLIRNHVYISDFEF